MSGSQIPDEFRAAFATELRRMVDVAEEQLQAAIPALGQATAGGPGYLPARDEVVGLSRYRDELLAELDDLEDGGS